MQYRNGRQGMVSSLQPRSVKSYISPHPDLGFIDPPAIRIGNTFLPVEESTKFPRLWWDSRLSFKKHISLLKTLQGGSEPYPSGRSLEVGRGQTLLMLCRPLYAPTWTTVALCMAQHRIPIYDNWTAFTTLDWDCHWSPGRGSHGPWGHPAFHQECTIIIPRGTTSLKEWANVWYPEKPKLNSMSIMMHKDHMMKFTQMAPKWMREWGQRRSSTASSRMVRQPAANCPKDCQKIAPSLLLRPQPSLWHWTISETGVQFITM